MNELDEVEDKGDFDCREYYIGIFNKVGSCKVQEHQNI